MPIVEVEIPAAKADKSLVEVLGRAALTTALVADGIEVARPERDAGVDLLAFTFSPWRVLPIQMKAATTSMFSIDKKYERVDQLIWSTSGTLDPRATPSSTRCHGASQSRSGMLLAGLRPDRGSRMATTPPTARVGGSAKRSLRTEPRPVSGVDCSSDPTEKLLTREPASASSRGGARARERPSTQILRG